MAHALRVGHHRVDITPPLGLPLGGYANFQPPDADGVEAPLFADALFVAEDGNALVFVAFDLIAIEEEWGSRLRAAIGRQLGLPPEHVVLVATHTHFAPESRRSRLPHDGGGAWQAWLQRMEQDVLDAAARAAAAARPARALTGVRDVSLTMYNRRLRRPDGSCCTVFRLPLPEEGLTFGPIDPKLRVVRFDDEAGRPIALLVSVAIHPVVGGTSQTSLSPDYPGVLRRVAEEALGAPAVFALGTAGNIVPIRRGPGQRERIGQTLGWAAAMAAEDAEPLSGTLRVVHRRLEVPAAARGSRAEMQQAVDEAKACLEAAKAAGDLPRVRRAEVELRRRQVIARMAEWLGPGETLPFEITAFSLGELGVVCLPGEIFVETGLYLQSRSPFPQALVLSLANMSTGYLPTRTAFLEGGYEVSVTLMSPASEAVAADAALACLIEAYERLRTLR